MITIAKALKILKAKLLKRFFYQTVLKIFNLLMIIIKTIINSKKQKLLVYYFHKQLMIFVMTSKIV